MSTLKEIKLSPSFFPLCTEGEKDSAILINLVRGCPLDPDLVHWCLKLFCHFILITTKARAKSLDHQSEVRMQSGFIAIVETEAIFSRATTESPSFVKLKIFEWALKDVWLALQIIGLTVELYKNLRRTEWKLFYF